MGPDLPRRFHLGGLPPHRKVLQASSLFGGRGGTVIAPLTDVITSPPRACLCPPPVPPRTSPPAS